MHDKYKRRHRATKSDDRLRLKIAAEAARRLVVQLGPLDADAPLPEIGKSELYVAKRQAAAVLGHRIRPGDLPTDSEVRQEVLVQARSPSATAEGPDDAPAPDDVEIGRLGDHVDRFAVYKLRLEPLHDVKQNPKHHPEGDALYHSLQVFELARQARPYDEEFLLAALLHDVGKAIDPDDHVAAALNALAGTITGRTAWLIEHHMDLLARPGRPATLGPKQRRALEESEYHDDLVLLRELDDAGRDTGVAVGTVAEALAYLRGLEDEAYLEDDAPD